MKSRARVVKRGKHEQIDGKRLLGGREGGREGGRGGGRWREVTEQEEREREKGRDRKGEGLCLISSPGECLG